MPYNRPPTTATVWHRFQALGTSLRVQELTPDLFEGAIKLLRTHFIGREPLCKYSGIEKYPSAMLQAEQLLRKALHDHVSVACVTGDGVVVGCNIMTISRKEDYEPFQIQDKISARIIGTIDLVYRGVDVFQKYGVDRFLSAYGLVVDPAWRRQGVATEILKARINLCRSLGIKVTATVFTARASQLAAQRAGFIDLYEITYEELADKGFVFPGIGEHTESVKLMALVIDDNL